MRAQPDTPVAHTSDATGAALFLPLFSDMVALLLVALLVMHGLLHVLGFAKAFHLAELPQLTQAISPTLGIVWLAAAVLFVAAGVCLIAWPRGWWPVAAAAVLVSMVAIVPSWTDAKFGALANVMVVAGMLFARGRV